MDAIQVPVVVVIPDRYTCRGVSFLPNGQQFSSSVPAGEYQVVGECDLCYRDLGVARRGRAVQLQSLGDDGKWCVSVEVGAFLVRDHAKPVAVPAGWDHL